MKHYIYFSLLLICTSINAQTNIEAKIPEVDSIFLPKLTGEFFYESKQYIGEQYFNKEWAEGDILLSTGAMIYNQSLKYNGLFDEVIWLNNVNFKKFKLDKSFISDFWLKNMHGYSIHFKRINVFDSTDVHHIGIFAEVAIEGKMSLYIQRKINIIGSESFYKNKILQNFDDLKTEPVYFIKLPSNRYLKLINVRRNAFLKLFPDQKKIIDKIIRDNHLNVKLESDFIRLIDLMNKAIFL